MNDPLSAYHHMQKTRTTWSTLVPVKLETHPSIIETLDVLNQHIKQFAPTSGWVAWQRHDPPLVAWRAGVMAIDDLLSPLMADNWLLEAEFAKPGASLQLYRDGLAGWRAVEIVERDAQPQTGELPTLAEKVTHLGKHAMGVARLHYRVFWNHDPDLGYQARLARFAGLDLVASTTKEQAP